MSPSIILILVLANESTKLH